MAEQGTGSNPVNGRTLRKLQGLVRKGQKHDNNLKAQLEEAQSEAKKANERAGEQREEVRKKCAEALGYAGADIDDLLVHFLILKAMIELVKDNYEAQLKMVQSKSWKEVDRSQEWIEKDMELGEHNVFLQKHRSAPVPPSDEGSEASSDSGQESPADREPFHLDRLSIRESAAAGGDKSD